MTVRLRLNSKLHMSIGGMYEDLIRHLYYLHLYRQQELVVVVIQIQMIVMGLVSQITLLGGLLSHLRSLRRRKALNQMTKMI